MAQAIERLLVEVSANDQQLVQLQNRFREVARTMQTLPTSGIDAISKRVTLLTQGVQLAGTRAASLQALAAIEQGLQRTIDRGNATVTERIRLEQQLAQVQRAVAIGNNQAVPGLAKHAQAVTGLQQRYNGALVVISGAAETMARTGQVGGESARQILQQVGFLAQGFGPQGQLFGAVSIVGLAIVALFTRTRREIEETKEKAEQAFKDLEQQVESKRRRGDQTGLLEQTRDATLDLAEAQKELLDVSTKLAANDRIREATKLLPFAGDAIDAAQGDDIKKLRERREELEQVVALKEREIQLAGAAARNVEQQRPVSRAETTRITSADPKALAANAAQTAKVLRDAEQAFEDLVTAAEKGGVTLAEFDRREREIGDRLRDHFGPAAAQAATALGRFAERGQRARETITRLEVDKATDEFKALEASLTTTAVDNLTRDLEQLQETIDKLRESGAEISLGDEQRLLDIARARIENAREEEALVRAIAAEKKRAINVTDAQLGFQLLINEKQAQLNALTGEDEATQQRRTSLLGQIEQLQAAIRDVGKEQKDGTAAIVTQTQNWAGGLRDVANVALGVATALTGANSEITRAIAGTAQWLGGMASVADALAAARTAQASGSPLSTGQFALSLLPGIGQLVGGLGALLGGNPPDPEAERRAEILKENSKRLAELRDSLVDAVRISVSGRDLANIANADLPGLALPRLPKRVEDGIRDAANQHAGDLAVDALRRAGTSLEELRQVAEDFGVTLSESPTIEELRQLQDAIKLERFSAFSQSFQDQLRALESEFGLFNIDDPIEQTRRFIALLSDPDVGAPAIAKALGDFDPETPEGIAAARRALQELFLQLKDGSLDAEGFAALLGNLTPEEFLAALERIDDMLQDQVVPSLDDLLNALPAFERLRHALGGLAEEFELLDIDDPVRQVARIRDVMAGLVPAIAEAIAEFDIENLTLADLDAADARIKQLFKNRNRLTDEERGGLTAEEFTQALLDLDRALDAARRRMIDSADAATRDAERLADEEDRSLETARAQRVRDRLQKARDESAFFDDTTVQATKRLAAALADLSPAFAELSAGLELDTEAGIAAFNERLGALFERFREGGVTMGELGDLSFQEFLEALLSLESGSDSAADALQAFLDGLEGFADRMRQALAELDFELELEGITDPLDKLRRTIDAIASQDAKVRGAVDGIDIATVAGRAALEAALQALGRDTSDQVARENILTILRLLRSIPDDQLGTGTPDASTAPAATGARSDFDGAERITVQQAEVLSDVARTQLVVLRQIELNTRGLRAPEPLVIPRLPTPASSLQLPALAGELFRQDMVTAAAGAGTIGVMHVTIRDESNYTALPADQQAAAAEFSDRKIEQLDRALREFAQRKGLTRGITRRTLG